MVNNKKQICYFCYCFILESICTLFSFMCCFVLLFLYQHIVSIFTDLRRAYWASKNRQQTSTGSSKKALNTVFDAKVGHIIYLGHQVAGFRAFVWMMTFIRWYFWRVIARFMVNNRKHPFFFFFFFFLSKSNTPKSVNTEIKYTQVC